ncbi:MAG: glucose-6-phosphate isomerase [Candidatus Delongbacteria bacterium]
MLKNIDPVDTVSWKKLLRHYKEIKDVTLNELFEDKDRFRKFSAKAGDILLDYSKNKINDTTMQLLVEFAKEMGLQDAVVSMFEGKKINETENRAVLHTALRDFSGGKVFVDGKDVMPDIIKVRERVKAFSSAVRSGEFKGYTSKKITDVVNIGIGGSDLGPKMVCEALKFFADRSINIHFVSNVDGTHIAETLKDLDPETTLFLIASKTFTTQETMTNAHTARKWFLERAEKREYIRHHFAALSTNSEKVTEFGMSKENMFEFWDFVGGRYSVWSAIGLSVAISVGYERFEELLKGAEEMDNHFKNTAPEKNIPVILGLLGFWYCDLFGSECEFVLPYDQYLNRFPAFLQQLSMESNGKSSTRSGCFVRYRTGQVLMGEPGTNGQHSFYQLLHQGTHKIPCDFLCARQPLNDIGDHHEKLLSNFLAQTRALAFGRSKEEVIKKMKTSGMNDTEINKLCIHKVFKGDNPTNSIVYDKLSPKTLGMLTAMYEHKVFVQGILWNIYSFDQWGVELGKELAVKMLDDLKTKKISPVQDSSTRGLLQHIINRRI